MYSVEKYISKLLYDFFMNHKGAFSGDISKGVLDFINQKSDIAFENLYAKCRMENGRLIGFVACKCMPKKMEFEIYVK